MTPAELREAARAWHDLDPDPVTRAQVAALLALDSDDALEDRFGSRLRFGTAGLRGALGAGPNRMNRVVVQQTSAGLARFLLAREESPSAVVGYDARHNSAVFARDAAEVLAGAGVAVTLLPRALPTPVLAFAVRHLGTSAGVMVTASHNPAQDNGYKLYLGGQDAGSQLVAPADEQVLAEIDAVVAEGGLPRHSEAVRLADESVLDAYVTATARLGAAASAAPVWVYTPMHGVGLETVSRVLAAAGLPAPVVVPAQRDPDPDFPTVAFPNPEEPGALEAAFATASAHGAELVLANDPDADRLAVAIPASGGWRRLSGNEVGLLLAWTIAAQGVPAGRTFATSIVSTPGLAAVAAHFGIDAVETLTGFKWISRAPGLRFGFEEALGYLVDPGTVRDKDGVSALVVVLGEALRLAGEGRSIQDRLDEIDLAVGRFASDQVSIRVDDLGRIDSILRRLRADPPTAIGDLAVRSVDDLQGGVGLPPTDGLRYRLARGARLVVRPSGTEPKLKAYLDVEVTSGSLAERRRAAEATLAALRIGTLELLR